MGVGLNQKEERKERGIDMDFIIANFELIVSLVSIVILAVYAIATRQWSLLRICAYKLMLSAEREMALRSGQIRFNAVFDTLWGKAPKWVRKIYTKERMKLILQEWYESAKEELKP